MRVCVTGGAGFIGSHLAERLVAAGHRVTVLDSLVTGSRANLAGCAEAVSLIEGDVRSESDLARAFEGVEVIYHQAALAAVARSVEDPLEVHDVNVRGTLRVLEAARAAGARRVVFASSASVYGGDTALARHEDEPLQPRSPYAATKAAGEGLMSAWQATYGLQTVSLRYFNVYGPRQSPRSRYAAVVPRFVAAALAGQAPAIQGDGGQTRDFTWVGDIVDALLTAARGPRAPTAGPINLGGGESVSILELADLVGRMALAHGGQRLAPVHGPARPGDVRHSRADLARARTALAWSPATRLAEGLERLFDAMARSPAAGGTR